MARRTRGGDAQTRGKLPGHETTPAAPEHDAAEHDAPAQNAPVSRRFVTTRVEVEGREERKVVEMPAFEPEPWGDDAPLAAVGARVPRVDALDKVTGRARYTVDVRLPGMLHAVILRAPIPRGRVAALDLAPALALPGVRAAIAREDVPRIPIGGVALFDPEIRYAGQPLAAICAESEETARRALALVRVTYEPLPHVVTVPDALAPDAPPVRGRGNRSSNSPRVRARGDVERGLAEADVVVTGEYRTPVAIHSPLEPHAAVADWGGDQLTVWESTQGIFNTRSELAEAFGLPLTRVRVIKEYMGGGFGAKTGASTNAYVAAALARRVGRPVRCVNEREAEQMDAGNRPATAQRVTLGATRDGRLTAVAMEAEIPLGVGGWQGGPGKIYHELYRCPNVRTAETFVYVNASAMSSFRAPGHVEGAFGLECAMDRLARALKMDPLALRLANYAAHHEESGRPFTTKRLDECYRAGAARFGWPGHEKDAAGVDAVRAAPQGARSFAVGGAPRARDGRIRRGIGMASQVWGAGGGPPAHALVRANADGTFEVLTGSQDLGTGSRTVFAQIAADALGVPVGTVRVVLGDTDRGPYTGNSWGSMTVASVGPAVRMAAEDCRMQLFEAAAGLLDTEPDRLTAREGVIHSADGRELSYADLAAQLGEVMVIGRGTRGPNPDEASIMAFGAQFAEVEVDTGTGIVRVLRIVAAHDSGRIVNPTLAESQLEGGIIQGLGYALFEERVMDARLGLPMNPTLHDYKIPTLADLPRIEAFCVGGADTAANHIGVKGLAEPPIIPTAPAIANAVAHALGVEVSELPLTPWRVLAALRAP